MGRSRWGPSLASSAGARLMVIFWVGKMKPDDLRALRTRSRASEMVLLASPTRLKAGSPSTLLPSTSIVAPSKPVGMIEYTLDIMLKRITSFRKKIQGIVVKNTKTDRK